MITIDLDGHGRGVVHFAGVRTAVEAESLEAARAFAVSLVAEQARALGRPLAATATTPEGSVRMSVAGSGEVTVLSELPSAPVGDASRGSAGRPRLVLSVVAAVVAASGLTAWLVLTPDGASVPASAASPSVSSSPSRSVSPSPSPSPSVSPSPSPSPSPSVPVAPKKPVVEVRELRAIAGGGEKKRTARVKFTVSGRGVVPVTVAVGGRTWSTKVDLGKGSEKSVLHGFTKVKKGSQPWTVKAPGVQVSGKVWVR